MRGLRTVSRLAVCAAVLLLAGAAALSQTGTVPVVSSRVISLDGTTAGEVLVGTTPVIRINRGAGGYTAPQRAAVIAERLSNLLAQGYSWQNVSVGSMNNARVLMLGNRVVATADPSLAAASNTTPDALAESWRASLITALGGRVAGTQETAWPDWTNATTKIVPIVAVGTGISLGFAQVTGPQARVDDVRSVVQLQVTFQRAARIFIFVPSSTLAGLNRVQGVAVTALLQYQLVRL